jgi:hypothetical protein
MKHTLLICIILTGLFCSCKSHRSDDIRIKTANEFIAYVQNDDANNAFKLLYPGVYKDSWRLLVDSNIHKLHALLFENGVPDIDTWQISADTSNTNKMFWYERIVIPISDQKDGSFHAYTELDFDYTGNYVPPTYITRFQFVDGAKNNLAPTNMGQQMTVYDSVK